MNNNKFTIGTHAINATSSTYFIADIAANHDGDLERAKELIYLAKEAGADAAKFQHFKAKTIVSDYGFKNLGNKASHQKSWDKSIYDVYQDAEVPLLWTEELYKTCKDAKIDFFTSPYDINDIDTINPFVPAYKVGSGDITYLQIVKKLASYSKPIIIATGASEIEDVVRVMEYTQDINKDIVLMQCNTNYTAEYENFKYIHLNVLKQYAVMFPDAILGLSDHTLGHTTILGAVALGAKVIEKHFTDDNSRPGPDHKFSMNPATWKEMIDRTRELELALGFSNKHVQENEKETVVLQRRALRTTQNVAKGEILTKEMLFPLRPAPIDSLSPYQLSEILGKKTTRDIQSGDYIKGEDVHA